MPGPFITQVAQSIPFDPATTGMTATDVQAAIEELKTGPKTPLTYQDIASDVLTSTTSTTYTLLNLMTLSPTAGTWLVLFNGAFQKSANNTDCYIALFVGGVYVAGTERVGSVPSGSRATNMSIMRAVAVGAGQAVEIRYKTDSSTLTCPGRSLTLLRLA